MKLKSILILTLTFTFLVSTTGLPVFYHYCGMMGKKSLTEREMCRLETVEAEQTSCCDEMIPESKVQVAEAKSECCFDEFDFKKIEDNFSQNSNTLLISLSLIIAENNLTAIESETEKKFSQNSNYNLPPPKFGKELLNTIHQLKLDLPIC